MADDINAVAEKKLKSRLRKIKKVNKDEEEKEKFFNQLGLSLEFYLIEDKPEETIEGLIFRTSPEGKILDAEYSYGDDVEEFIPVSDEDLSKYYENFKDFKLETIDYKNEEEKALTDSQVIASLEVFMPDRKKEVHDSLLFWTTIDGKISAIDYSYLEEDDSGEVNVADPVEVPAKDIKHFAEAFKDFKLEFDD